MLAIFLIIAGGFVGLKGYVFINANFRDSSTPQYEDKELTPAPPVDVKDNIPSVEELRVLDILGNSDKLSPKQWASMLEWRNTVKQIAAANRGSLFINGKGGKSRVALTFDDGPDEQYTAQVLDILKQYKVPGTFFFKGNQLDRYASVVKRAYAEGNLVASHAYSHQELDKMSPQDIEKEIAASDKAFERIIGVQPAMIRPPYGAINNDVLKVCENKQERVILWSIDTLDWSQPNSVHIAQNVLANVRPGDIILMHSTKDSPATVQALPQIIEGLRKKGYDMVDLSVLLEIPAYK
jgi:peptidoglycan/xylan/chitin deacetylase (PgdA/CDA1 family)